MTTLAQPATKVCTKCGEEKPATVEFFYAEKSGRLGLHAECKICSSQRKRQYYAEHREERIEYTRQWKAEHPEYMRQYRAEHREEQKEYKRQYRAEHWEERNERVRQWHVEHREERNEYMRQYRAEHPGECAAYSRNRYARKRGNGGKHTAANVRDLYNEQDGLCFYCDAELSDKYHVDHMIPIVRGGSNGPENLCLACAPCNRSKSSKHPMDFVGKLF